MTLLDRFRRWLAGLFGREQSETDTEADEDTDNTDATDGLDPDNVTEVRTEATDDSVAKLHELQQREQNGEEADPDSTAPRRDS
jgi:hypothetical protein